MSAIKDIIKVTEPPRTLSEYIINSRGTSSTLASIWGIAEPEVFVRRVDLVEYNLGAPFKPYFDPMTGTEPKPLALSREAKRYGSDDLPAFLR